MEKCLEKIAALAHSHTRSGASIWSHLAFEQISLSVWFAAILSLALLLTAFPTLAQNERTEDEETPEVLVTAIDELSEDFAELLDVTWARYSDRDVSIWLPDSFEQTLIEELLDVLDERFALLGPDLAPLVKALANSPELYRFAAFDPSTIGSGAISNVIVAREKMLFEFPALEIAKAVQNMLPEVVTTLREPEQFELALYDAAYAELLTETVLTDVISLQYHIIGDHYLYTLTLTTTLERLQLDRALSELVVSTLILERDEDE